MGFFKAYDMRGTYGVDFDLATVRAVGEALPKVVTPDNGTSKPRWLVGRDCRETSPEVRDALVAGLESAGVEVTDIGLCTTPMIYFFTAEDDFDGSVMITASHNPPTDNGLKVSKKTALPVGYADGLDRVEKFVAEAKKSESAAKLPRPMGPSSAHLSRYLTWMKAHAPDFTGLDFAVDCSNGMSSLMAKELFPGAEIINATMDGRFPAHSPNPLKADARAQCAELVRAKKLDAGLIFDGDADRCMFVDERGEFVQPDYLIPVIAKAIGGVGPVIHDVRTSRGAIEELVRQGHEPVMVPVGHAFAKPILRKVGAASGGELAGHYYFRDFFGCDSGVLAALMVLGEVAKAKREGKTFSEMMRPITSAYANSGEVNFRIEDKDAAINRALAVASEKFPAELSRSTMDGIRIEYEDGWINLRKSNTEPYLRLIAEFRSPAVLAERVEMLTDAIGGKKE